ncbi:MULTISPECIES: hypothetical protein [Legionella]|uniref:Uncharacterized protein n=1 Tax=Legionella drozanskii LLAP-1 TaxID=1212489 RepID=A0A0W0SW42_9GAMM|nr:MULTISPECIES: hypothetical protein [Legionella]KTC87141.1 hypothetical protein Ldro_1813 [Legionella drozanskii LLAP-1]PJE17413.1 MAG: hypothetical protein CK430_02495 [Legionella sp.]
MTLSMRVFTLNCGNGSLGETAAEQLLEQFENTDTDLFILNCQEVNFNQALSELANRRQNIVALAGPPMVTHTKPLTQLHNNTGMMTIILHKRDITVIVEGDKQARRAASRFGGSSYNKGGVLTRIVASKEGEIFTIDDINAHLDAFSDATRAQDWANIHRLQKYPVTDWKSLCDAIPDLSCSGYDANTRNKLSLGEMQVNLCAWENPIDWDMKSLVMAPLGNVRESQYSTYKSDQPEILDEVDPKRANRTRGGMVDLVAYNDVEAARERLQSSDSALFKFSSIAISPKRKESRDHAVIGSDEIIITNKSDFARVREAIVCSLVEAAPQLASYLLSEDFEDNEENKIYLLEVYKRYLSPEGLLQKHLQLHAERLHYLEQFQNQNLEVEEKFKQQIFFGPQPWFAIDDEEQPFPTLEELKQRADYQYSVFMLLNLHSQFLNASASKQERELVQHIVDNSLTNMPKDLPSIEQQKWIKQTNQLLSINSLLHSYDRHLQQETEKESVKAAAEATSGLLQEKVSLIAGLKETLTDNKNPGEMLENMDNALDSRVKSLLEQHRHDDFLTKLYHKLKKLITGSELSYGGFFVAETTKLLDEESTPIVAPNSDQSV